MGEFEPVGGRTIRIESLTFIPLDGSETQSWSTVETTSKNNNRRSRNTKNRKTTTTTKTTMMMTQQQQQ